MLLRDLPDHGAALLIDVLVGTFVADTAAYATGRMFGSPPDRPRPLAQQDDRGAVGGFLIGTMAFWFAGLYQDWLSGVDALIIGAAVAAIGPVGDLFDSMVKRDLGTKDTGTPLRPARRPPRPPRRRLLHGRRRLLPLGPAGLLSADLHRTPNRDSMQVG